MADRINDDDLELLGELGVETQPSQTGGHSPMEERIIAGFEEIARFVAIHGRVPQHGENCDIFERIYAVRLDRMRSSPECRAVLSGLDSRGLLGETEETASDSHRVEEGSSDEALLASLGIAPRPQDDLTRLVHVRSREETNAAEEIARRTPCRNFAEFRSHFEKVQQELDLGERQTRKYQDNAQVNKGDLLILDGQKVFVAEADEFFVSDYGRPDRRLRVVYDNGTESDLLARSLQRALNKDKTSRRITEPGFGPLFLEEEEEGDLPTGCIYVLRSNSEHPFVAKNRTVIHKIGVTGGDVKSRIANARKDPTYLLADVEVVANFKLANVNRTRLEALLHKFFGKARLDLELKDRFGAQVEPREWYLVPLTAIDEAVQKLRQGTIEHFQYDPETARIVGV
jgi:hypothetical protein